MRLLLKSQKFLTNELQINENRHHKLIKRMVSTSLLAIGLTMHLNAAFAMPRFVDSSAGVDSGTCENDAAPCRTITFAVGNSMANDTINLISIGGGQNVYNESGIRVPFNLTVNGISAFQSIIDGGENDRIFEVDGGNLTLKRLTLQNGKANAIAGENGGAVLVVNGGLSVQRSILMKNSASQGGAIAAENTAGTVRVLSSKLLYNGATGSGGAIHCNGCDGVRIARSTIDDNEAGVQGGAVFAQLTSLAIYRSRIRRNTGDDGGAVFANSAETRIFDSELSKNIADQGDGGGVFSAGNLSIQRSTLAENSALDNGGAVFLFGNVDFATSNSTYSANTALAGGALLLASNAGFGNPSANVTNSTFVNNISTFVGQGHHISGVWSTFRLDNSILRSSPALQAVNPVCTAPVTIGAANLISDVSCNYGGAAFNFGNVNGLNTTLAANGGIGRTHEIFPTSNAVDNAFNGLCLNSLTGNSLIFDQRRQARPVDGNFDLVPVCDIGAFELQ